MVSNATFDDNGNNYTLLNRSISMLLQILCSIYTVTVYWFFCLTMPKTALRCLQFWDVLIFLAIFCSLLFVCYVCLSAVRIVRWLAQPSAVTAKAAHWDIITYVPWKQVSTLQQNTSTFSFTHLFVGTHYLMTSMLCPWKWSLTLPAIEKFWNCKHWVWWFMKRDDGWCWHSLSSPQTALWMKITSRYDVRSTR